MASKTPPKEKVVASVPADDQQPAEQEQEQEKGETPKPPMPSPYDSALGSLVPNSPPAPPPEEPLDEATDDEPLPRYRVMDESSVLHDNKWYHPGDPIALNDTDAESLRLRRVIEPIEASKP